MAELNQQALREYNPFQGPIPGQSLTNSEDEQQAWEQPPEHVNVEDAFEEIKAKMKKIIEYYSPNVERVEFEEVKDKVKEEPKQSKDKNPKQINSSE